MPSNKKPRKPHRPIKIRLPGSHYSDAMVTELKSIVNKTALVIEITLPRGEATDDHMHCIQDFLNWGGIVVYLRRLKGQEEAKQEFFERYQEALHALNDILNRKNAKKTTIHYVGTAHELDVLRDVGAEICSILREGLETAPRRTVREFMAVKELIDDEHERRERLGLPHGVHEMDEDLVLRYLEKVA